MRDARRKWHVETRSVALPIYGGFPQAESRSAADVPPERVCYTIIEWTGSADMAARR